jgi:hypothetical protein
MSFDHMPVSAAEQSHAKRARAHATNMETADAETEQRYAKRVRTVDGVPVARQLADLCDGVRMVNKRIRFAVPVHPQTFWLDGIPVVGEVWAYFPGDDYCIMRLGYADYSVRSGSGNKYAVYSRHIKNEKFKTDRDHYYMVMTDALDRAVKNALKYMRPYTTPEVAHMSLNEFKGRLHRPTWEAANATEEALGKLRQHKSFISEMRALLTTAYQFNDPSFGVAVQNAIAKLDERDVKVNMQHHGYYVKVREHMGAQVFDVIPVFDIKNTSRLSLDGVRHTCDAQQLEAIDAELPNKLAALSMLDNDGFVDGLGHKVTETTYWVLR